VEYLGKFFNRELRRTTSSTEARGFLDDIRSVWISSRFGIAESRNGFSQGEGRRTRTIKNWNRLSIAIAYERDYIHDTPQDIRLHNAATDSNPRLHPPLNHILRIRTNNYSDSSSRRRLTRWSNRPLQFRPSRLCLSVRTPLRRARQMLTTRNDSRRRELLLYRFATHSLR